MVHKYMKRYLVLLVIREMQITTTMRCHTHSLEWLQFKRMKL